MVSIAGSFHYNNKGTRDLYLIIFHIYFLTIG